MTHIRHAHTVTEYEVTLEELTMLLGHDGPVTNVFTSTSKNADNKPSLVVKVVGPDLASLPKGER